MIRFALFLSGLLFASQTLAHHPLNGMPMETFSHGVLSGTGHPILGFDHLFFVLILGVAAAFTSLPKVMPLAYIATMLAGCFLVSQGLQLQMNELAVAASLLVIGGLVLSGRTPGLAAALCLFAGFGLFHGFAFGESIAGQEAGYSTAVLAGYLIGLGSIQYGLAILAQFVTRNKLRIESPQTFQVRMAGAMVAGMGLFLVLEQIEGPLIQAIF